MRSHRQDVTWAVAFSIVLAGLSLAGCGASEAPGARKIATQPAAPAGPRAGSPATASFEATVYKTEIPAGRVAGLDDPALAAAAGRGEDLQRELARLGPTKALYRASQAISLTKENRIRVGGRKPMVAASRTGPRGRPIRMVRYHDVGAMFRIGVEPIVGGPVEQVRASLAVEVSDMAEGRVEIAPGEKAGVIHRMELSYKGVLPVGRPFVMTAVDAASADQDANAAAYVCRVVLSDLK